MTEHGGHLGFLSRTPPRFWVDHVILEWLQTNARDAVALDGQMNFEVV
jgi:predicted alpha/beta-fold hydrolase